MRRILFIILALLLTATSSWARSAKYLEGYKELQDRYEDIKETGNKDAKAAFEESARTFVRELQEYFAKRKPTLSDAKDLEPIRDFLAKAKVSDQAALLSGMVSEIRTSVFKKNTVDNNVSAGLYLGSDDVVYLICGNNVPVFSCQNGLLPLTLSMLLNGNMDLYSSEELNPLIASFPEDNVTRVRETGSDDFLLVMWMTDDEPRSADQEDLQQEDLREELVEDKFQQEDVRKKLVKKKLKLKE